MLLLHIRNYDESSTSRVNNGDMSVHGGLFCARDKQSQILFYNKIMTDYLYYMTKYDINTIFIDFDKMITNKLYLFEKLKQVLDEKNIDFTYFSIIYDEVALTSKPKPK
jgi:hypothetical protein